MILIFQVPVPDTYRGIYREDMANPGYKYAQEVKHAIQKAVDDGRSVSRLMFLRSP